MNLNLNFFLLLSMSLFASLSAQQKEDTNAPLLSYLASSSFKRTEDSKPALLLDVQNIPQPASARPIMGLPDCKQSVSRYYESGGFDHDCNVIADNTMRALGNLNSEKTVIFGLDEVLFNNYAWWKSHDFSGIQAGKNMPAHIDAADAPAIERIKELYGYCVKKCAVVVVSGRWESSREKTEENLKRCGYEGHKELLLKSEEEQALSRAEWQNKKAQEVLQKYGAIAAWIGAHDALDKNTEVGLRVPVPNYIYESSVKMGK